MTDMSIAPPEDAVSDAGGAADGDTTGGAADGDTTGG